MKTEALRQALDAHRFRRHLRRRAARRGSLARQGAHLLVPLRRATAGIRKAQRPELWSIYNMRLRPGETMRVFPLSNWTELDIWRYIESESIPICPLYFAEERPVVDRAGHDDDAR